MKNTTEFKEKLINIQKRIGDIRYKSKTEIANDLSNVNKLDDLIVQLSGDCEDLTWDVINMKVVAEEDYYEVLNKLASDYTERDLPIWVKANKDYQKVSKRIMLLDRMLEEINRTQQTVNNRRYGLTNAIKIKDFLRTISTG